MSDEGNPFPRPTEKGGSSTGFFISFLFFFGAESLAINKVLFDFFTFSSIKTDNRVVNSVNDTRYRCFREKRVET